MWPSSIPDEISTSILTGLASTAPALPSCSRRTSMRTSPRARARWRHGPVPRCSSPRTTAGRPSRSPIRIGTSRTASACRGRHRSEAVHTPGHTPEHLSFLIFERDQPEPAAMLTGDFLFVNSVGRPDLLGDDESADLAGQLYDSVQRLRSYERCPAALPGAWRRVDVRFGHGPGAHDDAGCGTSHNPYLDEGLTREAFVQRVLDARRRSRLLPQDETPQRRGPPLLDQLPGRRPLTSPSSTRRCRRDTSSSTSATSTSSAPATCPGLRHRRRKDAVDVGRMGRALRHALAARR